MRKAFLGKKKAGDKAVSHAGRIISRKVLLEWKYQGDDGGPGRGWRGGRDEVTDASSSCKPCQVS